VTGAEKWKHADSLEAISRRKLALYLSVAAKPLGAFSTGIIQPQKPGRLPPDEYAYDPLDTSQAEVERHEVKNFITDQTYAINLSGDGLVYHSKPFNEETEISGFVRLVAWIAMDVPDTDFWVRLYEIKHDGTSIFLTEDWMRARYRESATTAKLVKSGKIERYEFNKFYFFSRTLAKRSVLRLVIRPPNSIYWQKNYNSGGEVSEESARDARTAHVKVFHDPEHASFLEVPTSKPIKHA
jgi:putative CocE/NonD family hydrolase